ncbi:NUDIX hydrolase [Moorella sulfitireducens]|uniref:NUDIX hydrolase n=1 Tax=Neomoorella sulfitireducens TaxID=2972948 RepID=UPI0021ACB628|nr:CoA pyrophosphatase [Moorella sulfitireducens]
MPDLVPDLKNIKARIRQHQSGLLDARLYAQSAVFLPLIKERDDSLSLLFEVRSRNLKTQPGEICFPGGQIKKDDCSPQEAAVRETCEELGLRAEDLEIWGKLDVLVTPFQQVIHPIAGLLRRAAAINPNPQEVAEVFTIPLISLFTTTPAYHEVQVKIQPPEDFPFEKIPRGRNYPWRQATWPELFYEFEGRVIWGMTARLLHHFLQIIS